MIKLPLSINNILNGKKEINETIIYKDDHFIILKDKKHLLDSYHYTAWSIKDTRSLIEIDINIIDKLKQIKKILLDKKVINESGKIFCHFPPRFWRLHIHFVEDNHVFSADKDEIHFIETIEKNIINNTNFYKENCRILNAKL